MILLCAKCGERMESLIIDRDLAYKEVVEQSVRHIRHKHQVDFKEMSKAVTLTVSALSMFMHMNEFTVIPESEKVIQENVDKMQDIVMTAMGYDPEEEDDEDIEDEDIIEEQPSVGVIELPEESDSTSALETKS